MVWKAGTAHTTALHTKCVNFGKFNELECCIEIDDYGETIRDLSAKIKKVAHLPVQKWNSILKASWWHQLFGEGAWWKKAVFFRISTENEAGSLRTCL